MARLRVFRGGDSRRSVVLGLGGAGGLVLILSDLLTLYRVDVVTASCDDLADPSLAHACSTTGGAHHGYALLLLGVLVLVMAWGAAGRGSRPAAAALAAAGAAAFAIAILVDLPTVHETGQVGARFSDAEANPGAGLWLELVGAGLALLAGTVGLARPPRGPARGA